MNVNLRPVVPPINPPSQRIASCLALFQYPLPWDIIGPVINPEFRRAVRAGSRAGLEGAGSRRFDSWRETRMATRRVEQDEAIEIGTWKVEQRLAIAWVEGRGPLNVADECGGHCCLHGVYIALPERDKILEYADRVQAVMDATQTADTREWFESEVHEDEDFPGGVCIGTATYGDKCVFLNSQGLCVLQLLEPELGLPAGERLKPFYCRLFPLTTLDGRLEFDDLCDGVRPCCTLASDGRSRAVDAYAAELREVLGEEGLDELQRAARQLQAGLERGAGNRRRGAARAKAGGKGKAKARQEPRSA
jgi:Fe-S-cluster containining protein